MTTVTNDVPQDTECTCGCTRASHTYDLHDGIGMCTDCPCQRFYSREAADADEAMYAAMYANFGR